MKAIDNWDEIIPIIEKALGFQLYDWQRKYLKGESVTPPEGRRQGLTLIYCVELILTQDQPIPYTHIHTHKDEHHGIVYDRYFRELFIDIHEKLQKQGLDVVKIY